MALSPGLAANKHEQEHLFKLGGHMFEFWIDRGIMLVYDFKEKKYLLKSC